MRRSSLRQPLGTRSSSTDAWWFVANLRPMLDHRIELALPEIEAETLVIRGEHDHLAPRYRAEEMAALAPRGRFAEVPDQPLEMRMAPLSALGWWALDYAYAAARQLALLGARRESANWRTGESGKPEIVLLPGVYEHWSFLRPLGDVLNTAGHRVVVVHGLGANRRPIVDTSARLERALGRVRAPAAGRVVVGHSKGGLIGKHLLLDGRSEALGIRGLVAVCTPFAGARRARLFRDPSIRALLPGDETIVMLGNAASVNSRIVSVFGTYDPHVPDGSVLDGATNVRVPVAGHFRVLGARETHLAVLDGIAMLSTPPSTASHGG